MLYLNEKLLNEDLIDDLGFRSDKSKWKNLAGGIWGTLKALARPQDLFEYNNEGQYEDFLYKGFSDALKTRGAGKITVTYNKKLYVIQGVSDSTLSILGTSKSVKGKQLNLKLAKIKVGKAKEGATGYETSGSYEYLRGYVNSPAVYLYADQKVDCKITQVTASRVILDDESGDTAILQLENIIVYPSENNLPTITNANIVFAIEDMVTTKDKEGNVTKPDFTVDKTLFNVSYESESNSPFKDIKEKNNETYQLLKKFIGKESNLLFTSTSNFTSEEVDVSQLEVIKELKNVPFKNVDNSKFTIMIKSEGILKPIKLNNSDVISVTEGDVPSIYLPFYIYSSISRSLKGKIDADTQEDTEQEVGEFDLLTPAQKANYTTSLMRFQQGKKQLKLHINNETKDVLITKVEGEQVYLETADDKKEKLTFDVDQVEKIEQLNIYIKTKEELQGNQPSQAKPEEKKESVFSREQILTLFS